MNSNNVTDAHESGQLLLAMCEEGYRDAAIVWIVYISWMLVVH